MEGQFQGDRKSGRWLLASAEERLKQWLIPKVPAGVETYHLTQKAIWALDMEAKNRS